MKSFLSSRACPFSNPFVSACSFVVCLTITGCGSSDTTDGSTSTPSGTLAPGIGGANNGTTDPTASVSSTPSSTPSASPSPDASSNDGGSPGAGGSTNAAGMGGAPRAEAGSGAGASPGLAGAPSTGGIRDVPATQIVEEMFLGWSLGNTLDADPDETAWGNPMTTQAMMDAIADAGFNTVRLPVTWMHHMGGSPNYDVDPQWMDRVEEVTNYVLSTGMYAIVNMHHEEWVSLMPNDDHDEVTRRIEALWTQIATRFRDYDDHLVFETLNEPRTRDDTEWTGGTPDARRILNRYNLAAVNAIRGTGGNNAQRFLMVPTHAANPSNETIADLQIPNDDPRIIVSLHTYYPYELSLGEGAPWGSDEDRANMEAELDRIYDLLPARGRAVVIGEWGTQNRDNASVRVDHAETYARMVRERGMCPVWWDNGSLEQGSDGFGLLDRGASPPRWAFQDIVTALVDGARAGN